MRRFSRVAVLLASAAVLLTGCAGASADTDAETTAAPPITEQVPLTQLDSLLDDPRSYVGASTAVLPDAAIVPVEEDPAQALPATVTSHDLGGDSEVEVVDTSRVVAVDLAGSIAATVWGLGFGETLVGVDQSVSFPGAEELAVVTSGGHTVNAESVIALAPTLVITDGSIGPRDVIEQLRDVGITVVTVRNGASFDGASELARDVAAVYGAPEAGDALASRIADEVAATMAEIDEIAPSGDERLRMVFLYLRGSAGVYYLFGEEAGASQLVEGLDGIDVPTELGWGELTPLTDEAIVAADPDLILVMTSGLESVGGVDGLLADKPAIALTTAGQNRRFVDMEDGSVLSYGPRAAEVLDALARAIYAPEPAGA